MKLDCFLVVGRSGKRHARVRRTTQKRPRLEHDEAVIRLQLELSDDVFDAPLLTVPIERRQIAIAVEVDEPV